MESIAFPSSIACSEELINQINVKNVSFRTYGFVSLKNIKKPVKVHKIYNDSDHYVSETQADIDAFIKKRGINVQENDDIKTNYITIGFLYPKNLGDMWKIDEEDENSFFSIEFNKQIIDYANKIDIIRTPSFEDIVKYKDNDLQEIAYELGLENLLQSTIMVDDDTFKIFFTLFSINSAKNIYEKTYEGKFHDMKNIIGNMLIDLSEIFEYTIDEELQNIFKKDINVDNQAYKLFLEGKHLSDNIPSPNSLKKAKLKLSKSIELDDQFAEAYAAIGITLGLMGDYDKAEDYLEEAEELVEESDNLETISFVYNYLGWHYTSQRKIKKSIRCYEKSLKSLKKLNDKIKLADVYTNLSTANTIIANNDLAINLSLKAEMIYKDLDERKKLANLYGTIGIVSYNMKKHDDTIKYYNLAKPIFLSEGMIARFAQVLILQAECYLELDEIEQAKTNLSESRTISKEYKIPIIEARNSLLMGKLLLKENSLSDALDYIDEAIDIFDELNNKMKMADSMLTKIKILITKGKKDKALKIYKKAKRLVKRVDDKLLNKDLDNLSKNLEH